MKFKVAMSWLTIALICGTTTLGFGFGGHNSPPVFDFKREWLIPENEPIGSRIITVRTRDEDRDSIEYNVERALFLDGSNYFTINPKSGDVFLKESLSGQAGNDYYLFVTANDGHQTAKIEVYVRVLDADRNTGVIVSNDVPLNGSSSALPPIRRPFPPVVNAQLPPPRPKRPIIITPKPHYPSAATSTTKKTLLLPQPSNSTAANSVTARYTDTTHQPISSVQTTVQPVEVSKSVKPEPDNDIDHSSRGTADRNRHGLDLITAFLPLLAAICFAPIAGLVFWLLHHRCQNNSNKNLMKSFSHKIVNIDKSESSETSISSVSGELDYNGALFQQIRAKRALNSRSDLSKYTSSLSSLKAEDKNWDFPRHHLRFIGILGEGCFGQVWKCEALNICNSDSSEVVAVKTLKENASEKEKKDLLKELEVMKLLDPHPNVVTLLGSCADRDPVFLIMEYVPYGKLQSYLRESRAERYYGNLHGSSRLTARDLTSFAYQVAKGMEYLSSKGIIHRDLAARNVLIGNNKTCRIADFGFARDVMATHVYERKSEGRLPIRWMAIESLIDSIFTTKSDVWSFGILMWEIVTLGSTPYPGLAAVEVMKKVRDGYRLEKPEHCKREMYNIMYYCWDTDPNLRPTFNELVNLLDKLLISEHDYIELDRFPDHSYYNIITNLSGEKL